MGGSPQVQVLEQGLEGDGLFVRQTMGNGTVTSNRTYQNLKIHPINIVLTPPGDLKAALSGSLVGRARGGFAQLDGSLQRVGLLEDWDDESSITGFAPVDDVFEAIALEAAQFSEADLASILRNHVISDEVTYSNSFDSSTANAASGAELNFSTEDNVLYVIYN
ncbi:Fasciclin domain protein [Ceratobasidium sp. AG-Ba]|nr:Fasciclin domain protein [Ceratobasidium sp. AG-Ba]QRW02586.1 Fasciclin domain protein [Ceratobasidium sp. AG-Ba]